MWEELLEEHWDIRWLGPSLPHLSKLWYPGSLIADRRGGVGGREEAWQGVLQSSESPSLYLWVWHSSISWTVSTSLQTKFHLLEFRQGRSPGIECMGAALCLHLYCPMPRSHSALSQWLELGPRFSSFTESSNRLSYRMSSIKMYRRNRPKKVVEPSPSDHRDETLEVIFVTGWGNGPLSPHSGPHLAYRSVLGIHS